MTAESWQPSAGLILRPLNTINPNKTLPPAPPAKERRILFVYWRDRVEWLEMKAAIVWKNWQQLFDSRTEAFVSIWIKFGGRRPFKLAPHLAASPSRNVMFAAVNEKRGEHMSDGNMVTFLDSQKKKRHWRDADLAKEPCTHRHVDFWNARLPQSNGLKFTKYFTPPTCSPRTFFLCHSFPVRPVQAILVRDRRVSVHHQHTWWIRWPTANIPQLSAACLAQKKCLWQPYKLKSLVSTRRCLVHLLHICINSQRVDRISAPS